MSADGPLRRMCWIFPDRESSRTGAMWRHYFWDMYAEIAEELGMRWTWHSPDAVTVDGLDPGKPRVYVDDELVAPEPCDCVCRPEQAAHA